SRRRHTRSDRDWSSDVCSSDLETTSVLQLAAHSAALAVPPEGELALHYRTTGRVERVPFRFEPPTAAPMLFLPSQEPGIWLPLEIGRASCREGGEASARARAVA